MWRHLKNQKRRKYYFSLSTLTFQLKLNVWNSLAENCFEIAREGNNCKKVYKNAFHYRYGCLHLKIDPALCMWVRCLCVCVYVTECKYWREVEPLYSTFLGAVCVIPALVCGWFILRPEPLDSHKQLSGAQQVQHRHSLWETQQITCNSNVKKTITLC